MLSKNLKYLRLKNGYSQEFIAEKLGYKAYTTIQKWESGVSTPPISKLKELSYIYDVDIDTMYKKNLKLQYESKEVYDSNTTSKHAMNLEDKVKNRIAEQGYTLKSFSNKINVPYTTLLTMLKKDIGTSSVYNVLKVANGLNTTVEDIMNESTKDSDCLDLNDDIPITIQFRSPQEAIQFILTQPIMSNYGGYNIDNMSDDKVLSIINDMLLAMKISLERNK